MSVVSSTEFGIGGSWLAEYTLDALQAGIVLFDQSCRVTQWNHTAARVLGRSEESLAGRAFHDAVFDAIGVDRTPVDRENNPIRTVLDSGEAVQEAMVGIRHHSGARIWLAVTALPVFGPDSTARAVLASLRDVTSEIEAHRLAYTASIEAHAAFDRSVAGQLVFDRNGRITRWNQRFAGVTGRDDGALRGIDVTAVFDVDLRWLWSALETEGGAIEGPMWVRAANGTEVLCYASFASIGDEHEPAVAAQIVDPRAVASACTVGELPDVFEHVRTPLVMLDDDGVVIVVNRAAIEIVGRAAESIVGHRLSEVLPGLESWVSSSAIGSTTADAPVRPVARATIGPGGATVDLFVSRLADRVPGRNVLVQLVPVTVGSGRSAPRTLPSVGPGTDESAAIGLGEVSSRPEMSRRRSSP
jgi:PAS domain S-box-containing protein